MCLRPDISPQRFKVSNTKLITVYPHHLQRVSRDVEIKAANGKSMKALKVFTEALRYLKDDALRTIAESTSGRTFIASDFTWVLTVPAIWDLSAKQFMREAATQVTSFIKSSEILKCSEESVFFHLQAGLVTERTQHHLIIALEPEAASAWCMKLPADGFITQNHDGRSLDQCPGTQFIVMDCGGTLCDSVTLTNIRPQTRWKHLSAAAGSQLSSLPVCFRWNHRHHSS